MPIINNSASKFRTELKNITATSSGDNATLLYEVPNNYSAMVELLLISSGNQSNKKISIQNFHFEDGTYHTMVNALVMNSNSILNILDGSRLNMHQKDKIVCFTDTSGNFDVTISVEEYFDPVRI